MSLLGKLRKCDQKCTTCERKCVLHFKHKNACFCETVDCAVKKMKCYKECQCGSICSYDENHNSNCFCGNTEHMWSTDTYPTSFRRQIVIDEIVEKPDVIKQFEIEVEKKRLGWDETWMEFAHIVARRSHDQRLKVGAIVVADDNTSVLALGYNGDEAGGSNLPESDEPGKSGFIHAEANCLLKCPYHYPTGKVMYVTDSPCRACAKFIVNARIKRVVYDRDYRDTSGIDLLKSAGVEVVKLTR